MFSILYPEGYVNDNEQEEPIEEPSFFKDLNLDQVIDTICKIRHQYNIKEYYYEIPKKVQVTMYRHEILKDLDKVENFNAFINFSTKMELARECYQKSQDSDIEIQSNRWFLDAMYQYICAIQDIEKQNGQVESSGMKELSHLLELNRQNHQFQEFEKQTMYLMDQFRQMRVKISISKLSVKIEPVSDKNNYCTRFEKLFPERFQQLGVERYVENPFLYQKDLSKFEQLGLELYMNSEKKIFDQLNKYCVQFKDSMQSWLLQLEQECQFYLSFLLFEKKYELDNYHFCYPKFATQEDFLIQNGYDLALLMKNLYHNTPVVANDVRYNGSERFLVVTGPNQGGKTTYARSVGQMIYFALVGLKVSATYASLPFVNGIMTHFSVEESMETGKGKLTEELTRLAPMMNRYCDHNFVIINELFTTAASYDALIMGKRVIKHFIEHGCYGIYVTHIQELAEETEEIVSIVAQVNNDEHHSRTFKMTRKVAEGIGYANGLVEKYHLTYPEIRRRLCDEGITIVSES